MEINKIYLDNCMTFMDTMPKNSVDLTLTDIPYGEVTRPDNGLQNLDKGLADIVTFELEPFLEKVWNVTKGTIIIFCGKEQVSSIHKWFAEKQQKKLGTVRQLIWQKSNPSPMNGQYVYLSGIENAIWFRKKGGTFNAHCKNTVFVHPLGSSKLHPTEKNHKLLKELIEDNSNEGQLIFDPCAGSGSTCLVAKELGRNYIGIDCIEEYYNIMKARGL
jgi:site-specific DNA-methyltransferase (adenine-specific)